MSTSVPWPFAATLTQVKAEGPATLKNRPNATMGPGGEVSPSYEHMTFFLILVPCIFDNIQIPFANKSTLYVTCRTAPSTHTTA